MHLLFFWWQLRTITFFDVPSCSSIFTHLDNVILFWLPIPVELYVRGSMSRFPHLWLSLFDLFLVNVVRATWDDFSLCSANVLLESLPISVTVMYNLSICSCGFLQFVIFNLVMDRDGWEGTVISFTKYRSLLLCWKHGESFPRFPPSSLPWYFSSFRWPFLDFQGQTTNPHFLTIPDLLNFLRSNKKSLISLYLIENLDS